MKGSETLPSRLLIILAIVTLALVQRASGVAQEVAAADSAQKEEVQALLREARTLVPKIEETQQSSAAANIAGAQVRAGDLAGALATVQILAKQRDRELAMSSIAYALTARGDSSMAFDLIEAFSEHGYNVGAYQQMAGLLAAKCRFEDALKAARMIDKDPKQSGAFVDTLMRIYVKQWEADDRQGAAKTFDEALEVVEREREKKDLAVPRSMLATMYHQIAYGLGKAGNREAAPELIGRIQQMVEEEEYVPEKRIFLRELAEAQASIGDFSAALETAQRLPFGVERDDALNVILLLQAVQGDPYGALQESAGISKEFLRLGVLREIAIAMADSGDYSEARNTIDRIPTVPDRAYALAQLALEQAKKNDPNAESTLELASKTASKAKTETDAFVFELISVAKGLLAEFSKAIADINKMDDKSRVWPLWNLTRMMVNAGKKDEAIALAKRQRAPHARAYALLGTADALIEQIDAAQKSKPAKQ